MAKSKYHLKVKGAQKGKRKSFLNGTNRTWLKTRHRIRQSLLR